MSNSYKFNHIGQEVEVWQSELSDGEWGYCAEPSGCGVSGFATQLEAISAAVAEVEAAISEYYSTPAHYYLERAEYARKAAEPVADIDF